MLLGDYGVNYKAMRYRTLRSSFVLLNDCKSHQESL